MAERDYKKLTEEKSRLPENSKCVDCGVKSPKWASVRYGTFFCLDCAAIHRSLGIYLDFVKSVTLDGWDKEAYLPIEYGGNGRFQEYLKKIGLVGMDIESKYKNSDVIQYSKDLMRSIQKETGLDLRSSELKATRRPVSRPAPQSEHRTGSPKPAMYSSASLASSLSNITSAIGTQVKSITEKTVEYGVKIGSTVRDKAKSLLERGADVKISKEKKEPSGAHQTSQAAYKGGKKSDWS